MSKIRHL